LTTTPIMFSYIILSKQRFVIKEPHESLNFEKQNYTIEALWHFMLL
jgi:hypothetical protein